MYDQHDRDRREACHSEYVNSVGFSALESIANQRGYRKATISEVNASAESHTGAEDLFCWCGGLWAKL